MMLLVTLVKTKSEIQNQAQIEDLEKELQFKKHAPFIRIIEKKIAFLKEYLGVMEANPTITLDIFRKM